MEETDLGVGDAAVSRGGNGGASFFGKLGPCVLMDESPCEGGGEGGRGMEVEKSCLARPGP